LCGDCGNVSSAPHGKIEFSGTPDFEQILIRVKQIQTNNVLNICKRKIVEYPLFPYGGGWGNVSSAPTGKLNFLVYPISKKF